MPVLKYDNIPGESFGKDRVRRFVYTKNLMSVVIDFTDGPWDAPEPPHSHPHEQTSCVVIGEIIFYCEGEEEQRLKAGDLFYVSSGKEHTIRLLTPHVRLVDSFTPVREDFLS